MLDRLIPYTAPVWAYKMYVFGQHNFEFRSVSRFHGKCGGAGLISISQLSTNLADFSGCKCWKIKVEMKQV